MQCSLLPRLGQTPLAGVAYKGYLEIAELLLQHGASTVSMALYLRPGKAPTSTPLGIGSSFAAPPCARAPRCIR